MRDGRWERIRSPPKEALVLLTSSSSVRESKGPPVLGCFPGTLVTFYPAVKIRGILCVDLLAEERMRGVRNLIMAWEYLEEGGQ